ncbi:FHA domain containing protein [Ignisphaera aggregans DSM 17230]|uniref:FHA domain containing protein n=1 Tax=Ignisphaera aggregans (strain DSM 17230 / JCM 13409 / AQ1.S1) TaxID=583356 RepID=E0STM0_IGNAA|nr:FHA domain containing protein [Ignisphaera aggregans DSM 17230]
MLYIVFERPRKPYPIAVKDYAMIYRTHTGVEVVFEYDGSETVLGADLTVSRRIPGVREGHVRIFRYGDKYYVMDLCSTNGTLVDGYLLKGVLRGSICEGARYELRDGSLIVVGYNTSFRTMFASNIETLPVGAYIIRSIDELRGYPSVKIFPLDEKNVIVKLPDKPDIYGDRVKLEELNENRKFTTAQTLVTTLLVLMVDVSKEDVDAYSNHIKSVLDILESEGGELGINIDRSILNLLKYTSSDRIAFRNLKRDIENAIKQILNSIQMKYRIPIPI